MVSRTPSDPDRYKKVEASQEATKVNDEGSERVAESEHEWVLYAIDGIEEGTDAEPIGGTHG